MSKMVLSLSIVLTVVCHDTAHSDEALRRKLGQLFVVGFIGPTVSDSLSADLSQRNIGGVILSYVNGNLASPEQIRQLTAQIRSAAQTAPFICADQEGGKVARLSASNGFASTYSAYMLGMVFQSVDSTRVQAALMASWMQQSGFNLDLAPVVDVARSPYASTMYSQRLFSTDPQVVTAHAEAFIDEFRAATMMTVLKHFPGWGDANELIPYRQLLDSHRVDMVMVAHHLVPSIDGTSLTSLSAKAIQGLLRDSLGFDGVVITDDMYQMNTTSYYGYGEAARRALNAGNDILLYVGSIVGGASLVRQIVDTLEADVLAGRLAQSRVDEAYDRIMGLKQRYGVISAAEPFAEEADGPGSIHLSNYPNPFNSQTVVRYQVPTPGLVRLRVFDQLGRDVSELVNEWKDRGTYELRFDGRTLTSGVYYLRMQAGEHVETGKLLLMR